MADWEKYEVPDWVVDDYNSRVSEEDRLPLEGTKNYSNTKYGHVSDETAASIKRLANIQHNRTVSDMIGDWIDDNQSLTKLLIIIFSAGIAAVLVN